MARAIKDRLELDDLAATVAFDGSDGLKKALADRPDLILLDLIMPGMDGITMLKKLRGDLRGKDIPVVVLSNMNNAQSMDESLASGAQEFLVKVNSTLDDVARVIKRHLGI